MPDLVNLCSAILAVLISFGIAAVAIRKTHKTLNTQMLVDKILLPVVCGLTASFVMFQLIILPSTQRHAAETATRVATSLRPPTSRIILRDEFNRGLDQWLQRPEGGLIELVPEDGTSDYIIHMTHPASDNRSTVIERPIPKSTLAGKRIAISCMVKGNDIVPGPVAGAHIGKCSLTYHVGVNKVDAVAQDLHGTFPWRKASAVVDLGFEDDHSGSVTVIQIPPDAERFNLWLGLQNCKGEIWFDSVEIVEMPE